jgi:hypothetical protein
VEKGTFQDADDETVEEKPAQLVQISVSNCLSVNRSVPFSTTVVWRQGNSSRRRIYSGQTFQDTPGAIKRRSEESPFRYRSCRLFVAKFDEVLRMPTCASNPSSFHKGRGSHLPCHKKNTITPLLRTDGLKIWPRRYPGDEYATRQMDGSKGQQGRS